MLKDGFRIYVYTVIINGKGQEIERTKRVDYKKFYEYHKAQGNKAYITLKDSYFYN